MKPAIVLLFVAIILGVARIVEINPRDYAYLPLLFPVIASSTLFGFGHGLLAAGLRTLVGDYLFALRVCDFSVSESEDAIGLAAFTIFGGAAAWVINQMGDT